MPPVLDPENSKVDGLAFLGLSLARNHYWGDIDSEEPQGEETKPQGLGHPDSYTHQTAFDLNEVIDREYEFLQSTDDNGWLVGGGEAGPPTSYKLAALDSAHVEIMRVGTYRKDWGGLDLEELLAVMNSGSILVPQIEVLPTDVVANPDTPPELEIRFDMECASEAQLKSLSEGDFDAFMKEPELPINWQLRFLHNQFFKTFVFPSRFCPGAFHSTILRKADFRSDAHRTLYFCKCAAAIQKWRERGPRALNTVPRHPDGKPLSKEEIAAMYPEPESGEHDPPLRAPSDEAPCKVESQATAEPEAETGADTEAGTEAEPEEENSYVPSPPPTEEETEAMAKLVKKLEDLTPLPPKATTALPSVNLEIALDAEEEEEEESTAAEPEETQETTNTAGSTEGGDLPTTDGLYRHTWDDVVRVRLDDASKDDAAAGVDVDPATIGSNKSRNCHSGIWLFTDRENITHFFQPNFLPPYDTPEKKRIIFDVLREEWDEKSLGWKPCGQGSMSQEKPEDDTGLLAELQKAENLVSGVLKSVIDNVCSPQPSPRKLSSAAHF
ncbi:unnamed protein product [Pseudo-nitzschia multistriata]|uniref:Uncharacterized protein n=1 Tax=Pseudo-nitzschia multistriata TaxID=183589 RepID=A0A448Z5M1_9STRA|nr:unnamed protein product [Pseudo-nitzschia multistriata]